MDVIYDVGTLLTSPRTAFRIMEAEGRGVGQALAVMAVFVTASALSTATDLAWILKPLPRGVAELVFFGGTLLSVALSLLAATAFWAASSLIAYGIARALGGRGSLEAVMITYAYSSVASVIYVAVALATAPASLGPTASVAALIVGSAASTVATLYVQVRGLQVMSGLSVRRAVATALLTFVATSAAAILALVMIVPVLSGAWGWSG